MQNRKTDYSREYICKTGPLPLIENMYARQEECHLLRVCIQDRNTDFSSEYVCKTGPLQIIDSMYARQEH